MTTVPATGTRNGQCASLSSRAETCCKKRGLREADGASRRCLLPTKLSSFPSLFLRIPRGAVRSTASGSAVYSLRVYSMADAPAQWYALFQGRPLTFKHALSLPSLHLPPPTNFFRFCHHIRNVQRFIPLLPNSSCAVVYRTLPSFKIPLGHSTAALRCRFALTAVY
ncbi:hypothetical protein B0H12DRAFT_519778 [Mycena haematopus]|nr:hypothetical protein B0H12DRAFT_519778 [Mycena haematopus]